MGNVEGFRKFGMNPAVGSGVQEEMWELGTIRTLPTAAFVATLSSSSAADDLVGTGARKVIVMGLDENYAEVSETVDMDGLSNVSTTQTFLRVFRAYATEVGTGGVNAGNITITLNATNQLYIAAGAGQSALASYTVPAAHTLVIDYYAVGVGRMAGSSDANIEGQIRLYDETSTNNYQSWRSISNLYIYNGANYTNDRAITLIPEKTDIRMLITSSVATQAHGVVAGYLAENEYLRHL